MQVQKRDSLSTQRRHRARESRQHEQVHAQGFAQGVEHYCLLRDNQAVLWVAIPPPNIQIAKK